MLADYVFFLKYYIIEKCHFVPLQFSLLKTFPTLHCNDIPFFKKKM